MPLPDRTTLLARLAVPPIERALQAVTAPSARIEVEVVTTVAEFADLAPAWNRLHDQAAAASVFNSWLWLYEWWLGYGGRGPLRLLVARRGGAMVGVLPLYIDETRVLGVRVRLLRFVGTGGDTHPDDLGPVLAAGTENAAAAALACAALTLPGVDVWLFSDIDPRSPFPAALGAAARQAGRPLAAGESERIAFVRLPGTWARFLEPLGRERRWRLRRTRRRLHERHRARFFVWDDPAGLDAAVARLAELHRLRWAQAGGTQSFASPTYIEFHRSVIRSFLPRGWLRLYCLEVDGEIGAMLYCYRFRRRVYLMQSGFDPKLARFGVGKVLLGHAIEHAIAEQNEVFDFLRGEHRYKEELATGHRQTSCVRAFAASPGALAYRLRRVWLPALKVRLQAAARAEPRG